MPQKKQKINSNKIYFNSIIIAVIAFLLAIVSIVYSTVNQKTLNSQSKKILSLEKDLDTKEREIFYLQTQNYEINRDNTQNNPTNQKLIIKKPDLEKEYFRGNKNTDYVIVTYSDLDCPYCKRVHPELKRLVEENSDLAWVYRHYPLVSLHPNAFRLAEVVECSAVQGGNKAYWDTIDILIQNQGSTSDTQVLELVNNLGYDKSKLESCLQNKSVYKELKIKVDEAISSLGGSQLGTPTNIFYNLKTGETKVVSGAVPYTDLERAYQEFKS